MEFEAENDLQYACSVFNFDKLRLLEFEYDKLSYPSNFQPMNQLKNICKSNVGIRALTFL